MNARFWTYKHGDYVKITLRPGQSLEHYHVSDHDEGWSSEWVRWAHEGDHVVRQYETDGRDCDGRMTRSGIDACPLDKLAAHDSTIPEAPGFFPMWEEYEPVRVYDEYAQASGY